MADGLVIRHPQTGAVIFNTETITSHSRAAFNTTGGAGSQSVAGLLRGTPFVIQALPATDSAGYNVPDFTISGSTVSWNAAARNMRVLVGSRAVGGAGASQSFDGFVVRRPAGAMQISTADFALQLVNYGSLVLTDDGANRPLPMVQGSVTISGVNPVMAFRGQDGASINIWRVSASGGAYTFHFTCQSSNPVGLIWWVFDVAGQALTLSTDAALVLRDSTNVKTFDSRAYAFNVVTATEVIGVPGSPTNFSSVPIPAGRSYAVIQSTSAFTNRQVSDNEREPGELGPNQKWMTLSSTYAAARFSGSTLTTGMSQFEFFAGAYLSSTPEVSVAHGRARHTIIDVTGLPSASMPSPTALAVSVSSQLREVTIHTATPASSATPAVTASASGGTAPYSFEWSRRIGGGGVGPYDGITNQASFRTQVHNQPPDSVWEEEWGCRVTDAAGRVGHSLNVVFRHIAIAIDLTPDPISYANVATVTNDATGFAGVPSKQITGVSQAITLRMERFNYSGNADTVRLLGFKGGSATGPWTQIANLDARGSSTRFADFTITNGEWFYFYAQAETTSGRKTAAFDVAVWNESGGHVTLASANLSMVVDDDNDFNVADYTLDPVNFTNLSFSTNSSSGSSGGTFGQFTGINREITVRVSISGRTGSMSTATLGAHSNPTAGPYGSGGPWEDYSLNALTNSNRDFLVRNGQWMYFDAFGSTASGRKDHGYTVTLTNLTTGQVIDTFTVSGTVDADNNYNVADYDLNAVDWSNIFFDTTANSYYTTNAYRSMSGINQNIQLSFQMANMYISGPLQNSEMYLRSATRGVLGSRILLNGTTTVTVQPNEQINFGLNVGTTGGRRQFGFDVYVYNQTTGALVDHFYCSGYVGS